MDVVNSENNADKGPNRFAFHCIRNAGVTLSQIIAAGGICHIE